MVNTEIRLIVFFQLKMENSLQSAKTRPRDDCGSDHAFLIATFRIKLKKAGQTTRPFRYDLNKIPYDYAMEMTNKFKGLDLIDRVPDELWTEVHDIVGGRDQDHPQEREMQKGKMVVRVGLRTAMKRREVKGKGEKERYSLHLNAEF